MSDAVEVVDNEAEKRFEVTIDGHHALLTYKRNPKRMVLEHTEVPDELEGRGVGSALVKAAIAYAVEHELTVVPRCPFARSWLERHPDQAAQVSIVWPGV